MRTEAEIRQLIERFTEELHRAQEQQLQEMVVQSFGTNTYQISLMRVEKDILSNIAVLHWVLGEVELS